MAQKGRESLLGALQKTVINLSQKINSLEAKVDQQSVLISQLKCFKPTKTSNTNESASAAIATSAENKALQRPIRQARLKQTAGEAALKRSSASATVGTTRRASIDDSDSCAATPPAKPRVELASLAVPQPQNSTPLLGVESKVDDIEMVNEGDWKKVIKRSRPRNNRQKAVIRGSGVFDSDLQTVERVKKIHACFFKPDTSEEALEAYMKKKSPGTYEVKKLKLKHSHYASFMIIVPNSKFDFFMSAELWPPRTEISEWFQRGDGRAVRPLTKHALRGHTAVEQVTQ